MNEVTTRRCRSWALGGLTLLIGLALALGGAATSGASLSGSAGTAPRGSAAGGGSARIAALIAARVPRDAPSSGARVGVTKIQLAGTPCGQTPGLLCSRVDVPLDRTGAVPGGVSLHVEVLPPLGVARGTIFLVAGGPGQGSAHVFGLGSPSSVLLYRYLFPGYTLVAYDDRGTGDSGLLDCTALQASGSIENQGGLVGGCAAGIGPTRAFYSTREHAEDLEAVRQALGVDKVALWGTSYGTKLAVEYALAHPDHVERLVLDSVVPPELPDPYEANVLRAMPGTLNAFCAGGVCRGATNDLGGDVAAVANRLAAKPVVVKVLLPNGSTRSQRLSGLQLISMVVDADLSPGLAALLPAAIHAARLGSLQPLARLVWLDSASNVVPAADLSSGLYAATVCRDGPFPWDANSDPSTRPAVLGAALKALPAGTFGPFGSWAAGLGNATFCLNWPAPSGGVALPPGPLPDVPVLVVSGGFDMRTPTAGGTDVASRFRQGRLLVVPGVGHSVLGADVSFCSQQAVHDWMLGGQPAASCARPDLIVATVPAYAAPQSRGTVASPARTLAIAAQGLRDAEALWLTSGPGQQLAGVYGGRLIAGERGLRLVRYSTTPGVELSGSVRVSGSGLPLRFEGAVTVGGASGASGVLGVSRTRIAGTLDGTIVG